MAKKKTTQKTTMSAKARPAGQGDLREARATARPAAKAPPVAPERARPAPSPAEAADARATMAVAARVPGARDPRTPPVGTVLQKKDRHGDVRCECTVEADGFRYAGKLYRSLSGAAMAAARDLGLTNKTFNGWVFWGVTKVARPAGDPLESLARAWDTYRSRAAAAAKTEGEQRARVAEAIHSHAAALTNLAADVSA